MIRRDEELVASACHVFNAIPGWGMIASGLVWFRYREESRFLVRHATQALYFHGVLLAGVVLMVLLATIAKLMGVLLPTIGGLLTGFNGMVGTVLFIAYVAVCLYGGYQVFRGRNFRYPIVGEIEE